MSLLSPTEVTILKLRRHPIVFVMQIFPLLFFLVIPPLLIFLANISGLKLPNNGVLPVFIILLMSVYYLYMTLYIFFNFFLFFLDRWMVTDRHIIDIEQKTLFRRVVAKQELERVQDVTAEINGFMQTLFNYGDVSIQTAGTQEHFVFEDVPAPHFVADVIIRALKDTQKKHP